MKNIQKIQDLFLDKERAKEIEYMMKECKRTLGLNNFWCYNFMSKDKWEQIKDNNEKQLDITLDYLYLFLRDGKLKMKILYHKLEKTTSKSKEYSLKKQKEYSKEEALQGIQEIKKQWKAFNSSEEKESFENSSVLFTLPENEWEY